MNRFTTKLICMLIAALMLFGVSAGFCRRAEASGASTGKSRDTVLVLDESGSMYGSAMTHLVAAAEKFCSSVLSAPGKNRVAVVLYSYNATLRCGLTDDIGVLVDAIEAMYASGNTNMQAGLEIADNILSASTADIKNVVLMSDGLPNNGSYNYNGRYTSADYDGYYVANAVYDKAVDMQSRYTIYTLGFFHSIDPYYLPFAARFLEDLSNATYSQVEEVEEIEFTFGNIATQITDTPVQGTFRYPNGGKDHSSEFYYSDSYFCDDSFQYKQQLATLSLCLAMSAFGSEDTDDYAEKSRNVEEMLTGDVLEFKNFAVTDTFKEKPGTDTIAAAIASKPFKDGNDKEFTLIAVAIRGGGYEREWASNFTMGSAGEHDGFDRASNDVLDFIKGYIADPENKISGDIKLWITGYSRAAATANMTAGKIDSGESLGDNVTLDKKDLYAYCFETPSGTVKSGSNDLSVYGNIFNIVNPNDLVTKVAPTAMGFRRYGYDRILPTRENKYNSFSQAQDNMKAQYAQIESVKDEEYVVGDFVYYRIDKNVLDKWLMGDLDSALVANEQITLSAFLDQMISGLVIEDYITRPLFSKYIEDGVRELCKAFADEKAAKKAFEKLGEKLISEVVHLIVEMICNEAGAYEDIAEYLYDCLKAEGFDDLSLDDIKRAAIPLIDRVLAYGANHLDCTLTLMNNGGYFFPAHYPELCFAWMRSFDPNYFGGSECYSGGSYRIIHINCPVDVDVYDEGGNRVGRIKDGEADGTSLLTVMINSDGEKIVYLPADSGFTIRIEATEDGTVDYSVDEFSYEAGAVNRVVCYYDTEIKKGEVLRAVVPAYGQEFIDNGTENGTDTIYSLYDPKDNELEPDADVSVKPGADDGLRFKVSVTSANEELGKAVGSGVRQLGAFAKVMAFPEKGMAFNGWYEDDKLVSSDEEYRFRVTSDVELVAVFGPQGGGISPVAILVIGLAVVGLLAGVLIPLLVMNGKKDKQNEQQAEADGAVRNAGACDQAGWQQGNQPDNAGYNPYGAGAAAYGAGANRANDATVAGYNSRDTHYVKVRNGSMEGYTFVMTPGAEIRIGKNASLVQMVLSKDYQHVSRDHCSIVYDKAAKCFFVTDSSSNGTYIDGRTRLRPGERTAVDPGCDLWLGNEECRLELR